MLPAMRLQEVFIGMRYGTQMDTHVRIRILAFILLRTGNLLCSIRRIYIVTGSAAIIDGETAPRLLLNPSLPGQWKGTGGQIKQTSRSGELYQNGNAPRITYAGNILALAQMDDHWVP